MKQQDILNFKTTNSHSLSSFTFCIPCKWNVVTLPAVNNIWNLKRSYCSFFVLKNTFLSKRGDVSNRWCCWWISFSFLLKWEDMLINILLLLFLKIRILKNFWNLTRKYNWLAETFKEHLFLQNTSGGWLYY